MVNNDLISLLERALNQHAILLENHREVKFTCPNCHHYKRKLEICIDDAYSKYQNWNCWVCGSGGMKGKTIYSLLKRIGTSEDLLEIAKGFRPNTNDHNHIFDKEDNHPALKLPDEFISLSYPTKNDFDPEYYNALLYLRRRNIFLDEIIKYNIGYCERGPYKQMVVIPSYDSYNQLNFFVGRSYYDDSEIKHKNPNISKDIIGFENMINWNLPITLVEGAFDAIAVKRNAIPLFGKIISDKIKLKIAVIENDVKDIYIALDNDALKDVVPIARYFIGLGINVYRVDMPGKDPSELGYDRYMEIQRNTVESLDQIDLLRLLI